MIEKTSGLSARHAIASYIGNELTTEQMKESQIEPSLDELLFHYPGHEKAIPMCWDWSNNELYIDSRMIGFDIEGSLKLIKKYNMVISHGCPCISIKDACDLMPEQKDNLVYFKQYFINNYDLWDDE